MSYIYDNGTKLIGKCGDILEYTRRQAEAQTINEEDYEEILEELKDKDFDTIVCIDYDFGMGMVFDFWDEDDKLEYDLY